MIIGRVYSIRSHQTTDIYIGSTTQALSMRMSGHRKDYKCYLNKTRHYISSFDILKYEDAYIEIIFEGEFENKNSLSRKEGEYIRELPCINKRIEGRTHKEYYEDNKERLNEKKKEYNEINREKIAKAHHDYWIKNKEIFHEKSKAYREQNKEVIKEKSKEYFKNNREIILKRRKQWYEDNKKVRLEKAKEYREKNKELLKEKAKQKFTCICGSIFNVSVKATHERSKTHIAYCQEIKQ